MYKLNFMNYYIIKNGDRINMVDCYFKGFLFVNIIKKQCYYEIQSNRIADEYDKKGNPTYNKRSKDLEYLKFYLD